MRSTFLRLMSRQSGACGGHWWAIEGSPGWIASKALTDRYAERQRIVGITLRVMERASCLQALRSAHAPQNDPERAACARGRDNFNRAESYEVDVDQDPSSCPARLARRIRSPEFAPRF